MIYETRCTNCEKYFIDDEELELVFDEETQEYCMGCPNCETDGNLMDLLPDDFGFDCSLHESPRTLDWCENNCPRYYSCDTVASANDEAKELYS